MRLCRSQHAAVHVGANRGGNGIELAVSLAQVCRIVFQPVGHEPSPDCLVSSRVQVFRYRPEGQRGQETQRAHEDHRSEHQNAEGRRVAGHGSRRL